MPFSHLNIDLPEGARLGFHEVANGSRLRHIHRAGHGRRIIGVTGIPTFISDWTPLIAAIPGQYDVWVVERAGYGESSGVAPTQDMSEQVAGFAPLLPEEGATSEGKGAIVIGHSYGSVIALNIALAYPDRVAGVLSLAGPSDETVYPASVGSAFGGAPVWATGLAAKWSPPGLMKAAAVDAVGVAENLRALASGLSGIKVPVMLAHGDRDPIVPIGHMAHREALLPPEQRAGTMVFPGALHNVVRTDAEDCVAALAKLEQALTARQA